MKRQFCLACIRCGTKIPASRTIDSRGCLICAESCPANLRVTYPTFSCDPAVFPPRAAVRQAPSLWRYCAMLPYDEAEAVSLGEGLTPLIPANRIGMQFGIGRLLIKDESRNPTWSHKDRFSTVAISAARASGAKVVATSSSGNAGASLAAYAARAGIPCVVVTFAGTAGPMLEQIRKYGATVVSMVNKRDRWPFLAEGVQRHGWFATSPFRAPVVGSHPIGIEGYKTLAYEIVEQMHGEAPDWCALPVCYGDALAGLWQGFQELRQLSTIPRLPRLIAAEVHGSLAAALRGAGDEVPDVGCKFESIAVSIGAPKSTFQALNALRESDGVAVPVANEGLIALQEGLAAHEGIFCELSSATPFAAIAELRRRNVITSTESVVAVVTASGLKDVDRSFTSKDPQISFKTTADAWRYLHYRGLRSHSKLRS